MFFLFRSVFSDIKFFFRNVYSNKYKYNKKNSISVVVNDIETSCLVGGVPAKFIKKVQ